MILAALHVACLENPSASGRYFGVCRSWAWEEILETVQNILSNAKMSGSGRMQLVMLNLDFKKSKKKFRVTPYVYLKNTKNEIKCNN